MINFISGKYVCAVEAVVSYSGGKQLIGFTYILSHFEVHILCTILYFANNTLLFYLKLKYECRTSTCNDVF